MSSAAASQGSDVENKLPPALNDTVGLFVLCHSFWLTAIFVAAPSPTARFLHLYPGT